MKLAGILLSYAIAIGVLFSTLVGGVMWLVQPGPAISQEARAVPIPPRIVDSIERKKPIPVEERRPEPVKPAMQEANVSLAPAPVHSTKIREPSAPVTQARKRRSEQVVAREAPAVSASSPARTVSTARSDFPH
jgi:hypothetical protein